jgi:hypothetical protein
LFTPWRISSTVTAPSPARSKAGHALRGSISDAVCETPRCKRGEASSARGPSGRRR